ncbi:MAG: presenilin family intramembrane aspartyl protease [Nanoarchaeota archaeon]
MKHTLKITLMLVLIFFTAQIVGLSIVNSYIDHKISDETGEIVFVDLPYDIERPPVEEGSSFAYIITAVLIGTGLVFLLIKFKKQNLWRIWFLLAVILTLAISFSAFILPAIAFGLAAILAIWKVYKPNPWIHNITEVFVYGGLAAIFVPMMNIFAAVMLLLLISVYDMIAVWKSKHMVAMAKFQTESNVFAGLTIPYKKVKQSSERGAVKKKVKTAILGGGDIGFPLLFAGVIMKGLMMENIVIIGFLKSLIIPVMTTVALFVLLVKGKENRFYPAMPFLSIGCFVGYAIVLLL